MNALNCRLGDLAVTIRAELPENVGNIVRVVGCHGVDTWWGFRDPIHLWEVEVVEGGRLVYECDDGSRESVTRGLAPDAFLKPIAPAKTDSPTRQEEDDHAYV